MIIKDKLFALMRWSLWQFSIGLRVNLLFFWLEEVLEFTAIGRSSRTDGERRVGVVRHCPANSNSDKHNDAETKALRATYKSADVENKSTRWGSTEKTSMLHRSSVGVNQNCSKTASTILLFVSWRKGAKRRYVYRRVWQTATCTAANVA